MTHNQYNLTQENHKYELHELNKTQDDRLGEAIELVNVILVPTLPIAWIATELKKIDDRDGDDTPIEEEKGETGFSPIVSSYSTEQSEHIVSA